MLHILNMIGKKDKDKASEALHSIFTVLSFVVFVLSLYLGVRDMSHVRSGWTKFWVMALAIFMPELYVILHGIQSSAMGVPFFKGTPVDSIRSMSDISSLSEPTPSFLGTTASSLTPSTLSSL